MTGPERRPVVVVARPRPREVLLDSFFLIAAIGFFLGVAPPTSIETQVPEPWQWVWYLLLFVGGGLILTSHFRRRWVDRLLTERHGCWASAAGALIFAVAAFAYTGMSAFFAAGFMISWTCAQLWRIAQIHKELSGR